MASTCAWAGWPDTLGGQVDRDLALAALELHVAPRVLLGVLVPQSYDMEVGCLSAGLAAGGLVHQSTTWAGLSISFDITDEGERNDLCAAWDAQIGESTVGCQCDSGAVCTP